MAKAVGRYEGFFEISHHLIPWSGSAASKRRGLNNDREPKNSRRKSSRLFSKSRHRPPLTRTSTRF